MTTQLGGRRGGGAVLTPFGRQLVEHYRGIEREAHAATAKRLHQIEQALRAPVKARPSRPRPRRKRTA